MPGRGRYPPGPKAPAQAVFLLPVPAELAAYQQLGDIRARERQAVTVTRAYPDPLIPD